MTYALTTDNGATIQARRAELPAKVWVADTDTTGTYQPLTPQNAASFGWFEVVRNDKPADTATATFDRSFVVSGSQIVETWTERPKTQAELDADDTKAAQDQIRNGITALSAYLDIPSPTAGDAIAQVRLLTRAVRRLAIDTYGGN